MTATKPCSWCKGRRTIWGAPCRRCRGTGRLLDLTAKPAPEPDDLFSAPEPAVERPALARTADPDTSHDAAASVITKRSQLDVLALLADLGPVTADRLEMEAEFRGLSHRPQRIRTALTELAEVGRVVKTTTKQPTRTGRYAYVWARVDQQQRGGAA